MSFIKIINENSSAAYEVKSDQFLLGSSPQCDLVIEDNFASSYHSLIYYDYGEQSWFIKNLSSINPTLVDGVKQETSLLTLDSLIQCGKTHLVITELKIIKNTEHDNGTQVLSDEELIFDIDNEWIESEQAPVNLEYSPFTEVLEVKEDIFDQDYKSEQSTYEIKSPKLWATLVSQGVIIQVDTIELKTGTIALTNDDSNKINHVYFPLLQDKQRLELGQFNGKEILINACEQYDIYEQMNNTLCPMAPHTQSKLNQGQTLCLQSGPVQIFLELHDRDYGLKQAPFSSFDQELKKPMSSGVATFLILLLLLLLINPPVEELKLDNQVAITYKASQDESSRKAGEVQKEVGEPTPEKMIVKNESKKQEQQKVVKNEVKPVSSPQESPSPKPIKKVSQTRSKLKNLIGKLNNSNVQLNQVSHNESSSSEMNNSNSSRSPASTSTLTSQSGSQLAKATQKLGKLGGGFAGKGELGNAGDSKSYLNTKTVVLGSIDPELLRKLLREYIPQFRHCYQKELETQRDQIEGIIDLKFRISPQGSATKIDVISKSVQFSPNGVNCMAAVLRLISFPRPKGGGVVDVKQPLNFSATNEKKST